MASSSGGGGMRRSRRLPGYVLNSTPSRLTELDSEVSLVEEQQVKQLRLASGAIAIKPCFNPPPGPICLFLAHAKIYDHQEDLYSPPHDIALVKHTFKALGVEACVCGGDRLVKSTLNRALRSFVHALPAGAVVVLGFSMHGFSVNGKIVLTMSDYKPLPDGVPFAEAQQRLDTQTMDVGKVLDCILAAPNGLPSAIIAFSDTCRDSPVTYTGQTKVAYDQAVAALQIAAAKRANSDVRILIMSAASNGSLSNDGGVTKGPGTDVEMQYSIGLYSFAKLIATPNLSVKDAADEITTAVVRATINSRRVKAHVELRV